MNWIRKYKITFILLIIIVSILIFISLLKYSILLENEFKDYKCNTCDTLASERNILIEFFPEKIYDSLFYIKKTKNIVEKGNLIFKGVDSYYLDIDISLGDTLEILCKHKKYKIYDFKRKYIEPEYNMGADKEIYSYELKHPCVNYQFTVVSNNKIKIISENKFSDFFVIKELDFNR